MTDRLAVVAGILTLFVAGALAPATNAFASSPRAACRPGSPGEITSAYAVVFGSGVSATADERAQNLQGGTDPGLRAVLDQWLGTAGVTSTIISARRVHCLGADRATVRTETQIGGNPMPGVLPRGQAVLQDGIWKVARRTFCLRMRLQNPALGSAGACAAAPVDRALSLPTTTTLVPRTTTTPPLAEPITTTVPST
ncbi:MAG: hypothetical protein WCI50_04940 [Actinomycetes bacterium]